ncbi:MAG: hypothetical protein E6Q40_06135 [Cupriavidus sp.]|nr:MAG: hypothetical protein E6Q40_06135 [Cupriavidus sp.]
MTNAEASSELGGLYFSTNRSLPPFANSAYTPINIINQAQVSAGHRLLNVMHTFKSKDDVEPRAKPASEAGATLWLGQDATGSVAVFISPYKSDVHNVLEDNFIIGRHSWAGGISERQLKRYFATYFRYCAATSAHGDLGLASYMLRVCLKVKDIRYRSKVTAKLWPVANWLTTAVITLYAGGKLLG